MSSGKDSKADMEASDSYDEQEEEQKTKKNPLASKRGVKRPASATSSAEEEEQKHPPPKKPRKTVPKKNELVANLHDLERENKTSQQSLCTLIAASTKKEEIISALRVETHNLQEQLNQANQNYERISKLYNEVKEERDYYKSHNQTPTPTKEKK